MIRFLLQYLLPLLLPTLLWFGWMWLTQKGKEPRALREGPWVWLIGSGIVLMGAALVATAFMTGSEPGGKYVPPYMEDGKIVPGRVE